MKRLNPDTELQIQGMTSSLLDLETQTSIFCPEVFSEMPYHLFEDLEVSGIENVDILCNT